LKLASNVVCCGILQLTEEAVRKALAILSLILLFVVLAPAQSSPQALQYAAQAITALTGSTAVSDITINANATRTVGSDVGTGTATLYAKGQYESLINMVLSTGNRSETLNGTDQTTGPQGEWIDAGGTPHLYSPFNCVTDASWFYPALSSLAFTNNQNQLLSYVGAETLNGEAVQHLQSTWNGSPLTTMDFYLDATTFLPVATNLNVHPDSNSSTNIPVQILFSNYQNVNGVEVPFHIQELLNGTVLLDVTVTGAVINSGLPDSLFTIQ
jgi:hypothetical protein